MLKRLLLVQLGAVVCAVSQDVPTEREKKLMEVIEKLEARVSALEQKLGGAPVSASAGPAAPVPQTPAPVADALAGTTYNLTLDGYYEYNFNRPINRVNQLRAYDVSSNSFSLNQATFVIERAPDMKNGRRYGARVDLQYGQATESAQGNPANEPRPQVYRPIWQAYGTYIVPVGSGLTVDFGKWASSLGYENNFTKDQINYSRSYLFNYLPYYHMGFRSTYNVNNRLSVGWWLVNGIQQTEDFNGFKSNAFLVTVRPTKSFAWNVNYYLGQEGHDASRGKTHIFDSTLSWNANSKLLLAGEADSVIVRVDPTSAPSRVLGGALYARYQPTTKFAVGGRGEYFSDRGGTFSGSTQALKEMTGTLEYKIAEGFLVRNEFRRDFSNHPYFLTDTPGLLKKQQTTATLGLIWWFGNKEGAW